MNFLHLLANLDAFHALLDPEEERPSQKNKRTAPKSHVVKFAQDKSSSRRSSSSLRSTSGHSSQEATNGTLDPRPKSGKSLTFQLGAGRQTPALSVSTAEYKYLSRRDSKIPISATKVIQCHDGYASGRTTQMSMFSTIREGARSPTPNAIRDGEPAFHDVMSDECGISVWRIQGNMLGTIDIDEHGFFHEGNAYIILNIEGPDRRTLHYWCGSEASEVDRKTAEEKAHQLDQIVGNAHVFSVEKQGFESTLFLHLFYDGLIYIEGKHKQWVGKSSRYDKRLYIVTGRKYPKATCVYPKQEHIDSANILILDGFPRMYVWIGNQTGYVIRTKAIRLARKLQTKQRKGRCHLVVIDENDSALNAAFRKKFEDVSYPSIPCQENTGTCRPCGGEDEETRDAQKDVTSQLVLHRVSGDKVLYDMPEAAKRPLKQRFLVKRDSYLLDRGSDVITYVWVGSNAMEDEVNRAISRAKTFNDHHGYATHGPLCRIREDHEPTDFKRCFCDWRDKLTKEMCVTKRYSAGNVGRALFSQSDRRTVATASECWSEDTVGDHRRNTNVWVLNNGDLETWDHVGLFTNNKCFLVLHTTIEVSRYKYVLYYWLGEKSESVDRDLVMQLALDKNSQLEHAAVVIRVLDGREPSHFMAALENWMLVYDAEENEREKGAMKMFSVRDCCDRATRIQQVCPQWSSLNSSASFVVLTEPGAFLWYGKMSGSTEREGAKELLGILCQEKMYSPEVITEGKETSSFLQFFGTRQPHENEYKTKILERRPASLILCLPGNEQFELIDGFLQEDLSEEEIFILDTFDQIFVWCGEQVDATRRKKLFNIAKTYLRTDPAAREQETVALWAVSQRSEPVAFTKHFQAWNALGYSGRHSYEMLRKKIRQENARIDVDENMVDTTFLSQPKYPYKMLLKKDLPHDVDDTNKHNHLSEKQFREHLKMSRLDFYRLPVWKQRQVLQSARLLFRPTVR